MPFLQPSSTTTHQNPGNNPNLGNHPNPEISDIPESSDLPFYLLFIFITGFYVFVIVAMVAAEATYTTPQNIFEAINTKEIRYSIGLSLVSTFVATVLSLWVAVPTGYLLSRHEFPGKSVVDAVLDIPIVLPPLVIGLCLLILFQTLPGQWIEARFEAASEFLLGGLDQFLRAFFNRSLGVTKMSITYDVPSVIIAQFMVACAFAVRTMRVTFDQISPRCEQVALTLGCGRSQAFWLVVFPQARRGLLAAGTLAWARSLGEFGPILIFSGATRMKTEVLPTTVYLELGIGNLEGAVAASLILVAAALVVLINARLFGLRQMGV